MLCFEGENNLCIIPFLIKFKALICFSLSSSDLIISKVSDPGEYLINPFCSARLKTNSLSPLTGITIESLYRSLNRTKFLSAPSTSTLFATINVGFDIFRRQRDKESDVGYLRGKVWWEDTQDVDRRPSDMPWVHQLEQHLQVSYQVEHGNELKSEFKTLPEVSTDWVARIPWVHPVHLGPLFFRQLL